MRSAAKHLSQSLWPAADRALYEKAFTPGDIFDDARGAGADWAEGTRRSILSAWGRWLGFLAERHRSSLDLPAADRITPERVRAYVEHLGAELSPGSVAVLVAHLYDGARVTAPDYDWRWLRGLKRRLQAHAHPEDRFERLIPACRTLDLGIRLMREAELAPADHKLRELQYRDGLIIALLSLWPIRRRSLAALTVDRHVTVGPDRLEFRLFPEDTKSKRMEIWTVPKVLCPYFRRYLAHIRPVLGGGWLESALWLGQRGGALRSGAIYDLVCRRISKEFGKAMSLHDFRRAAATFLAMEVPEKVGLIPGILQHAGPSTAERHYNLARGMSASRRHSEAMSTLKARLRPQT